MNTILHKNLLIYFTVYGWLFEFSKLEFLDPYNRNSSACYSTLKGLSWEIKYIGYILALCLVNSTLHYHSLSFICLKRCLLFKVFGSFLDLRRLSQIFLLVSFIIVSPTGFSFTSVDSCQCLRSISWNKVLNNFQHPWNIFPACL